MSRQELGPKAAKPCLEEANVKTYRSAEEFVRSVLSGYRLLELPEGDAFLDKVKRLEREGSLIKQQPVLLLAITPREQPPVPRIRPPRRRRNSAS